VIKSPPKFVSTWIIAAGLVSPAGPLLSWNRGCIAPERLSIPVRELSPFSSHAIHRCGQGGPVEGSERADVSRVFQKGGSGGNREALLDMSGKMFMNIVYH